MYIYQLIRKTFITNSEAWIIRYWGLNLLCRQFDGLGPSSINNTYSNERIAIIIKMKYQSVCVFKVFKN